MARRCWVSNITNSPGTTASHSAELLASPVSVVAQVSFPQGIPFAVPWVGYDLGEVGIPERGLGLTPLLFDCAKTVSEFHLREPLGLLFERKQIPQIVVNVRS